MQMPYLADAREVATAADLMERFGLGASREAALRADRSRDIGNTHHFCRWRQIERLIAVLETDCAIGSVH